MSTRKLLLADDSVTIQKVVNLTFADEGIEVISVGNGDAAMEKMAEITPDLVMADVNMPGLSGYQVCERIKQDNKFKQTPVILLVGSFEPFDEDKAREVGADDFLTKPFQSIRQLVSKVTVLLDANARDAAQLYDATANSNFADTLDVEAPKISSSDQANDLGDAGMDDEMIQTNQVSGLALDESAKFETKDFESDEDAEDYKRTQPLSVYDLKEFSFVAHSPENESESRNSVEDTAVNETESENFAEDPDFNEIESPNLAGNETFEAEFYTKNDVNQSESAAQNSEENLSAESNVREEQKEDFASFLDSADDDLLEIPFDEEWETEADTDETTPASITEENGRFSAAGDEAVASPNYADSSISESSQSDVSTAESAAPNYYYHSENEVVVGTLLESENNEAAGTENNTSSDVSAASFSPELIEAIAQKVIEKLSDSIVREIAWEVVPEHADLIIKKMVEEKLKE